MAEAGTLTDREQFEREALEEWPDTNLRPVMVDGTFLHYFYGCTQCKWEGWQLCQSKVAALEKAVDVLTQHIYNDI